MGVGGGKGRRRGIGLIREEKEFEVSEGKKMIEEISGMRGMGSGGPRMGGRKRCRWGMWRGGEDGVGKISVGDGREGGRLVLGGGERGEGRVGGKEVGPKVICEKRKKKSMGGTVSADGGEKDLGNCG